MNTESIVGRKVAGGDIERVGDFRFDDEFEHLYVWLPGTTGPDAIRVKRGAPGGDRVWGWDGNVEKPTLTPSIHAPGQWHGYMVAGVLKSC